MFDAIRSNKRIVQFFLILITIPFALWGVESYVGSGGSGGALAKVAGSKITQQDFEYAMREQQDAMRAALGREYDPKMLETPEAQRLLLERMVNERAIQVSAAKSHLAVSDGQLRDFIGSQPVLQEDGQFSKRRYDEFLRSQNRGQEEFEYGLRRDLIAQQIASAVTEASLVSRAATERWLAAQLEEREITEFIVKPEAFLPQVNIDAAAVKAYYDSNPSSFTVPQQIRAEYLVLSPDILAEKEVVTDQQIKAWYEGHLDRYRQPEERRASHILVQVPAEATEAQIEAARATLEDVRRQVDKDPDAFAGVAKARSQDGGSAQNGGDLGFFGRGMMVKPFEDAAFALKEGEISDIVRSDFGFHLIKLTEVKPERGKSLDEVKGEIGLELKTQAAQRKFAEIAESFSNTVYEQPDSLKPAAEKYGLTLRQSDWVAKGSAQVPPELSNERLMAALFSDDAIKKQHNTEAVEVAPSTLVSARVLEHKPAAQRPLESVAAQIEKRLSAEEAAKLARKDAEDKLARLAKGESVDVQWSSPRSVTREGAQELSPEGIREAFKLPPDKLPRYAGGALPGGAYAIYKVSAVRPAQIESGDQRVANLRAQYARVKAEEESGAFLASLRSRIGVDINAAALASREQ